jgi:hypothetical protein
MELISQLQGAFLQTLERVEGLFDGKMDFAELVSQLQQESNRLMCELTRAVLEEKDRQVREERFRRKDWVVERRNDRHTILVPYGEVCYQRTYYQHRSTAQYAYLSDIACGIAPHERIHSTLSAGLVEQTCHRPYRKSGRQFSEALVSGQTVLNHVRDLRLNSKDKAPDKKKVVEYLFIEADEDHVPGQKGIASFESKLVYVHEGWNKVGKQRFSLKNARYFGGVYQDCEQLWQEVWKYLDANYDLDKVEKVFLSGDGANWISMGVGYLPKAVFVADRYHIAKHLVSVCFGDQELLSQLKEAVWASDRPRTLVLLKHAASLATTPGKQQKVLDCRKYLNRIWQGIAAYQQYEQVKGCSAEGHVSHVLSARLSSRPGAWSKYGANQITKLRLLYFNGESIRESVLKQYRQGLEPLDLGNDFIRQARQQWNAKTNTVLQERLGNIPALGSSKQGLRQAINGLKNLA